MEGVAARSLRQYRQFFATYPEIRQTLPLESPVSSPAREPISVERWDVFRKLSFSHFAELIAITDETKRLFYFEFLGLKDCEGAGNISGALLRA